jgi:hypothetical protein
MVAAPLGAQQAASVTASQAQQPAPETAPPVPLPEAEQLPPPPPFPPMPSARPSHRWVDVGDRHSSRSHHRARASHAHAARAKHHATRHGGKRTAHKARPMHFSKRTIRACHRMSYREIMRHGSCRALIQQELAAPAHRHRATHHGKNRHKAVSHKATRHSAAKRHRR